MSQNHYPDIPDILVAAKAMEILAGKEKIQERVDGGKARAGVLPEIDSVGVLANNTRCWPQSGLGELSLSALKHHIRLCK